MSINRLSAVIVTAAAFSVGTAWAGDQPQPNAYAGEQQRIIKALSPQETADLEAGRGMGLSKVAELNHYPGPNHVLELAKPLKLSEAQIEQARQLQSAMKQDAQRVGKQILAKEAALETLFATRRADDAQVRLLIADLGRLQGELRFVHVNAHLATAHFLSNEQIAAYDQLRGYTDGTASAHPHHH